MYNCSVDFFFCAGGVFTVNSRHSERGSLQRRPQYSHGAPRALNNDFAIQARDLRNETNSIYYLGDGNTAARSTLTPTRYKALSL